VQKATARRKAELQRSEMSNPKPASYHNIHHHGIQIVRELSKVRIAPTIAVKQSILHEAYKVLS